MQIWHWLVIGLALMTLEVFLASFASLWFGVAALVTALLLWLVPMSLLAQVVMWLVLSVLCCLLWFRFIQPILKNKQGKSHKLLLGEAGIVIGVPVATQPGKVRFSVPKMGRDEWWCRSTDGEVLELGGRVFVVGMSGGELIVSQKHQ